MFTRNCLILTTLILMSVMIIVGQEKKKISVNANGEFALSADMAETAQRRDKLLQRPDFIKLRIAPDNAAVDENKTTAATMFRADSEISFELWLTNTLTEPFVVAVADVYAQVRPQLLKAGELIPYHEKAARLVQDRQRLLTRIHGRFIRLQPSTPQRMGAINLNNWYDSLEPGAYELTIKYNVQGGGQWIESAGVIFEIVQQ